MTLAIISPLPPFELRKVSCEHLPGFGQENFEMAAQAWNFSCHYLRSLSSDTAFHFGIEAEQWKSVAQIYIDQKPDFKSYLQNFFQAFELYPLASSERLFTGYYEPEIAGASYFHEPYIYPIYRRPSELIVIEDLGLFRRELEGHRVAGFVKQGTLIPAPTRTQIEEGAFSHQNLELYWVSDPMSLYSLHIQGGGKIMLEDGAWSRLEYDGTNGHAYSSLRAEMIKRGLLLPEEGSMATIKNILSQDIALQKELFQTNASFVFFKDRQMTEGPRGRIKQPLTPFRSLAVDPRAISLGMPLWVSTPNLSGFMTAQDVGGAIKGLIRGDIFCGSGKAAERIAGEMKDEGHLYVWLPIREALN